jgi:hypothetical protein
MSSERPLSERPAARPSKDPETLAEVSNPPPPSKGIGCFGCLGIVFLVFLVIVIISFIAVLLGFGGGGDSGDSSDWGYCTGQRLDTENKIKEEAICQYQEGYEIRNE